MQIPILNGIYTDQNSDFRTSYPRNLVPVPKDQGISSGYLRPAEGIIEWADVPGVDRGGISWNGVCYRACGTKLITIDESGGVTVIGDIGGSDLVTFDYSFDRLAVSSGGRLYYYDGATLSLVTDPDLGLVNSVVWVDGYFMTTDGTSIVVTDLSDPFSINPLKYGSSEVDPDDIKALIKIRNEVHVVNRHTIEVFDDVGGSGFPFQRIDGAQLTRGAIGRKACCKYNDTVAFLGGGRNEPASVWVGASGNVQKISTREIDQLIAENNQYELENAQLEAKIQDGHILLYVHLPSVTMAYDLAASESVGEPVWHLLSSGIDQEMYLARNIVWCHNKWIVGHPYLNKIGYLSESSGDHWGDVVGWEFGTSILYNESMGAIFHELELICLTGRAVLGENPQIATQYSLDGETWSQKKYISAGKQGQRDKRLIWLSQGNMRNWRIQRFNGTSKSRLSIARLEARLEPLAF